MIITVIMMIDDYLPEVGQAVQPYCLGKGAMMRPIRNNDDHNSDYDDDDDNQCCGFGSAWIQNFCLDLELKFRIRIQQKVKERINKTVNSGLFVLLDSSTVLNREWQIVVKILLFD